MTSPSATPLLSAPEVECIGFEAKLPLPEGSGQSPPNEADSPQPSTTAEDASQSPVRPFVIRLSRQEEGAGGHYKPTAEVSITPSLRTSGLLTALPAEEVKSLLLVLTFLTPNGDCRPSVVELAEALTASEGSVRARMQQLAAFQWYGKPLVSSLKRDSGLDAYALSEHLYAVSTKEASEKEAAAPPIYAAGRKAVIAHSRAQYARPREEVEEEIARLNGWPWPPVSAAESRQVLSESVSQGENLESAEVRRHLLLLGMTSEQADNLMARFPVERILRQVRWLPLRNAKHPMAFLKAAIEDDYEAPRSLPENAPVLPPPDTAASPEEHASE